MKHVSTGAGDAQRPEPEVRAEPAKADLTTPSNPQRADLPHERDESVGMTGGEPSEAVRQGHADVERGVKDTSRATESDQAYRRLERPG